MTFSNGFTYGISHGAHKAYVMGQGGGSPALASFKAQPDGTGRNTYVFQTQNLRNSFRPICNGVSMAHRQKILTVADGVDAQPTPCQPYIPTLAFSFCRDPKLVSGQRRAMNRLSTPRSKHRLIEEADMPKTWRPNTSIRSIPMVNASPRPLETAHRAIEDKRAQTARQCVGARGGLILGVWTARVYHLSLRVGRECRMGL